MFSLHREAVPSSLPLDIKLTSVADWLRARGHIKVGWFLAVKQVRKEITEALQDMPENDEIKELLSHTQITFYQSVEIIDILKKTEADTKHFLGYYSSQRMKDWKEIAQLYRADNLYLADAAFVLSNLVKYELPSIRKDLLTMERKIADQKKKIEKNEKLAVKQEELYKSQLQKRALQGKNIELELLLNTNSLAKTLDSLDELILKLSPAVDYYTKLKGTSGGDPAVPLLKMYFSKGKAATAFEWIYGYPPDEVKKFNLEDALGQLNVKSEPSEEEIDVGFDDVDISVEEIQVLEEERSFSKRRPTVMESLPLLENTTTRDELKNEIDELRYFLTAVEDDREREHPASMLLSGYFPIDVEILDVFKWNAIARQILDVFANPQTVEQFEIRYRPECLDEIVKEVEAPKKKADFHRECVKLATVELDSLKDSYAALANTFKEVKKETKKLEGRLCKDLAKFTNGRPVHLLGGVKSVPSL